MIIGWTDLHPRHVTFGHDRDDFCTPRAFSSPDELSVETRNNASRTTAGSPNESACNTAGSAYAPDYVPDP